MRPDARTLHANACAFERVKIVLSYVISGLAFAFLFLDLSVIKERVLGCKALRKHILRYMSLPNQ